MLFCFACVALVGGVMMEYARMLMKKYVLSVELVGR